MRWAGGQDGGISSAWPLRLRCACPIWLAPTAHVTASLGLIPTIKPNFGYRGVNYDPRVRRPALGDTTPGLRCVPGGYHARHRTHDQGVRRRAGHHHMDLRCVSSVDRPPVLHGRILFLFAAVPARLSPRCGGRKVRLAVERCLARHCARGAGAQVDGRNALAISITRASDEGARIPRLRGAPFRHAPSRTAVAGPNDIAYHTNNNTKGNAAVANCSRLKRR